jgi:phage/plasmid-like protein (TIGR03299 family)
MTTALEIAPTAPAIPLTATRTMPWHELVAPTLGPGALEVKEGGLTSHEMLKATGLDWDVAARPLWRRMADGTFKQSPTAREVFRTDTELQLGTVRGRYEVFCNREAFAFGDALVKDGTGKWVVAGQQNDGKRVFMVMQLGEGFDVLGDDKYESYLFIRTSHGDGTSISAAVVPFRVRCTNQSALARREAKSSWSIPHTTTVADRLEEARTALKLTMNYEAEFKKMAEQLAAVKISDEKVKSLVDSIVPARRSRRDDIIGDIIANYQASTTAEEFRGTGYGLLQGVTEYYDHVKRQRSGNARFESIMFGEGNTARNQLVQHLMALAV